MKIEIILSVSHLYHKLSFPGMLFAACPRELSDLADKDPDLELAGDWMQGIEQALTPFRERIARFFHPRFSLPEVLMKRFPLAEQDTAGWCAQVASEDPRMLARELLADVLLPGTDLSSLTEDDIPEFLNRTNLPQGARWMLWGILREPREAIEDLSSLYDSLRLLSDALIDPVETEAWQALESLDSYLKDYDKEWELLGIEPDLIRFIREKKDGFWRVMPSLIPWEFRPGYEEDMLIVGYRVPLILDVLRRIEEEELEARSMFCQSLADPTRYRLCCILARQPMLQKDLAERLGVSQATVSHHLQQLRRAGLLAGEKGRQLDSEPIRRFLVGMAADLRVG